MVEAFWRRAKITTWQTHQKGSFLKQQNLIRVDDLRELVQASLELLYVRH